MLSIKHIIWIIDKDDLALVTDYIHKNDFIHLMYDYESKECQCL